MVRRLQQKETERNVPQRAPLKGCFSAPSLPGKMGRLTKATKLLDALGRAARGYDLGHRKPSQFAHIGIRVVRERA